MTAAPSAAKRWTIAAPIPPATTEDEDRLVLKTAHDWSFQSREMSESVVLVGLARLDRTTVYDHEGAAD